ncbi:MAG: ABC transporter permease [Deltaproteobacteria bacterium]|nr:ABC transporter permease [Deltaproteobacteria bacterium]MBW2017798.1 ABC transporter permease [Deltaproteobacteria bacterium]MBW2128034.1 ABC transporter permease [Deltaproteobacteria bacterium]MBW2305039.1 ABC transporter permease [Deltaproteobacteria bacterium]
MRPNFMRDVFRDPWFMAGLGLAILFAVVAALGPTLSPYDPRDMRFAPISPPSSEHLLGVNDGGQDIFSELLYAVKNTVAFGLWTASLGLLAGVIIGVSAGWIGGWVDLVLMRIADVLLAVPSIMVLIFTAALFRPPPLLLATILAALSWPTTSKGIRAQTLSLKQALHLRAVSRMGAGNFYIIRRHLIPEMFPLYLVGFAAKARMAMFMEASLAFLGLFDPGRKSLGMMISYALKYYYMDIWWNWLMPPILCLSMLIGSVTFLAISLEKALDPRLRESIGGQGA